VYFLKDIAMTFTAYQLVNIASWWKPDRFVHSDNYILATNRVTPEHIVPEWYLLPFYGILRTIENKALGRAFRVASIAIFFYRPKRAQKSWSASCKFNAFKQNILSL